MALRRQKVSVCGSVMKEALMMAWSSSLAARCFHASGEVPAKAMKVVTAKIAMPEQRQQDERGEQARIC